jgi:hypothetical protein
LGATGLRVVQTVWMANKKRKLSPKTVLKLPDLEQSKTAVLNSLTSHFDYPTEFDEDRDCIISSTPPLNFGLA